MTSLRKGAPTKGPPRHQNKFAFKHNPNSKKTRAINKIAHTGLCKRCDDKIEWRKKYRKYKPLTAPGICSQCKQRSVKRAYHTLCATCAGGRKCCAKCFADLGGKEEGKEEGKEGRKELGREDVGEGGMSGDEMSGEEMGEEEINGEEMSGEEMEEE